MSTRITLEWIKNFTPTWFAATMGTGITALCLNTLSGYFPEIASIATGLWLLNICLFIFFTLTLCLQSILYPHTWVKLLHHPAQAMFLGCIPMGMATLINGFIAFGLPWFGHTALDIAYCLWWIDTFLSLLSVLVVPYFMFTRQTHSLENMTALWLLPFVACEVAAASGGGFMHLLSMAQGVTVLVYSLMLWSVSVALALSILVIFFYRLCIHKLPPKELATSIWLPLGPTATGALALLLIGQHSIAFAATPIPAIAQLIHILPGVGLLIGVLLWALASWWFMIALVATFFYFIQKKLTFSMGFWAYTFPLGVYTMATVTLGLQTNLAFFKAWGVLLVCVLTLIWLAVFIRTFLWKKAKQSG